MSLKEIKCPNCNANVTIDESQKKAVCNYCKTEFILDDNTIKVEHTGTIEISDDTSLQIAQTTLEKFKDYDKSLILYKRLLFKYAHKREVYLGLIRSITHDFNIESLNGNQLNEINEYFKKYKVLSTKEDIREYEEKINSLNRNFWYNLLIAKTNNFNFEIIDEDINVIEKYYHNYQNYCSKKDYTAKNKYEDYIKKYKENINQKKKRKQKLITLLITVITIFIIILAIILITDTPKKKNDTIKLSEINNNALLKINYSYFKKYFKKNISTLEIKDVQLNKEKKTVDLILNLNNILKKSKKKISFNVIDDMGPVITPLTCNFTDTEEINLNNCFELYDFTDGKIDNSEAIINKNDEDFKTEGIKIIEIIAKDKDGNENKLNIDVNVGKTSLKLEFNLEEKLVVGKKYTPVYKITPDNISDKTVTYTYDKNYIAIENGIIRVLKKGQTEICAISNYDKQIKICKRVNLELECKNSYTFKVDGGKEVTLTVGEVFCAGTYKIYAEVTNKKEFYTIKIKPKDSHSLETMTIYKDSSFLNDEGNKYILADGHTITTSIGITSIKFVKTK